MLQTIFWIVLRSIAIPFIAVQLLKGTPLGEDGAVLAVGIAMLVATIISIAWNGFKILGNTLLFRGSKVVELLVSVIIQIGALLYIWIYYFGELR